MRKKVSKERTKVGKIIYDRDIKSEERRHGQSKRTE